jgi:hypothetical protein
MRPLDAATLRTPPPGLAVPSYFALKKADRAKSEG